MPVFRKDGKNILFVHVPKAGGTSVERLFGEAGYRVHYHDNNLKAGSLNRLRTVSPQHMHAELLRTTFRLDRFDAIFMVTRDPIKRFQSEYAMRHPRKKTVNEQEVEEWADRMFKKYLLDPYHLDNHLRPQVEFYVPGAHVYRLEGDPSALPTDMNRLYDCGLAESVPRTHTRGDISGYSSSDVPLSAEMEQRIRTFYRDDYVAFGYE